MRHCIIIYDTSNEGESLTSSKPKRNFSPLLRNIGAKIIIISRITKQNHTFFCFSCKKVAVYSHNSKNCCKFVPKSLRVVAHKTLKNGGDVESHKMTMLNI